MREILFRGKRKDTGKIVFGYLFMAENARKEKKPYIWLEHGESVEVIPETVGQFTGLTDKNGEKVFEGDIVCLRYASGEICCRGDIQFDCGVFGAEWVVNKKYKYMVGSFGQNHNLRRLDDDIINEIEVIGNIHDNPELLKEQEE